MVAVPLFFLAGILMDKTTIDSTAENCETFCISAGKIGYQVELSPRDLAKVIRYQIADLTVDHEDA